MAAAAEMDEQIDDHRSQVERIETLLAGLAEGAPEDSIFPLRLWGHYVYAPSHPVLEDLANSASVEGLGIPELRFELLRKIALAAWQLEMDQEVRASIDRVLAQVDEAMR